MSKHPIPAYILVSVKTSVCWSNYHMLMIWSSVFVPLYSSTGTRRKRVQLGESGQGGVTDEKLSVKTSVLLIQIHHMLMIWTSVIVPFFLSSGTGGSRVQLSGSRPSSAGPWASFEHGWWNGGTTGGGGGDPEKREEGEEKKDSIGDQGGGISNSNNSNCRHYHPPRRKRGGGKEGWQMKR